MFFDGLGTWELTSDNFPNLVFGEEYLASEGPVLVIVVL